MVAESVLRQNGFDVIAVGTTEEAREVIKHSRPDLIIIGADLKGAGEMPYYEEIRDDSNMGSMPLLLFEPADKSNLDFPDEVIVPRPFDPKDFLQKVSVFLGQADSAPALAAQSPGSADIDDSFLDAALGIDKLDVTDSEVMDKTFISSKKPRPASAGEMVGSGQFSDSDGDSTDSTGIESQLIVEGSGPIEIPTEKKSPKPVEGTGKLDILDDQFGMTQGESDEQEACSHDYDWFVNSIKQDNEAPGSPAQALSNNTKDMAESGKLTITDPSATVDPISGPPTTKASAGVADSKSGGGVEKFIDDFKKEIEQLRTSEVESITVQEPESKSPDNAPNLSWDEELERITPQQISLFTRQFARELADKVARMIIDKIDEDKLLGLIRDEIVKRTRKKS